MTEQIELTEEIKQDLAINDLEKDLVRQASKFFYWATLKAKAAERARKERLALDELKARLGREYRDTNQGTRVTERMLDDYLDEHEDIKKAKSLLIQAQYVDEMLETAVEAFRERHYAMIELLKVRESEKMMQNEFDAMKKDFEKREAQKRGGIK